MVVTNEVQHGEIAKLSQRGVCFALKNRKIIRMSYSEMCMLGFIGVRVHAGEECVLVSPTIGRRIKVFTA